MSIFGHKIFSVGQTIAPCLIGVSTPNVYVSVASAVTSAQNIAIVLDPKIPRLA